MTTCCIVGAKGGIGKTTTAIHAAAWLHRQGRSIRLLDADPQLALRTWAREALPDVRVDVALDPDSILEVLPRLAREAQEVICDGPAGGAESTRALLLRSDLALLPTTPSALDVRSLKATVKLLQVAQSIRGEKPEGIVFLNKAAMHHRLSQESLEACRQLGLRVAQAVVRQRACVTDTAGQGVTAWSMGYAGRDAVLDFNQLFGEVFCYGEEEEKHL